MLAEQHIIMYEDEETGDVLGFSYVYDLTEQDRERKSQNRRKTSASAGSDA